MNSQKSKLEKLGIHRSHLNGIKRWLGSKGGRARFEKKRDEELERLIREFEIFNWGKI